MGFDVEMTRAAGSISTATALFVTAGAWMATEPGSGDPVAAKYGDPRALLRKNPKRAWGLFATRMQEYRLRVPHAGFALLARWAESMKHGAFALTSNADGQLQRAHFAADRLVECRGAMEWMQCTSSCGDVFPGGLVDVEVDAKSGNAEGRLPVCPRCGSLARPNVMLGDGDKEWDASRAHEQEDRLNTWLAELRTTPGRRMVVVECGAAAEGDVRARGERVAQAMGATLVRVDECAEGETRSDRVVIRMAPREALDGIDAAMKRLRGG